jgi:hypothetical protein
MVSDESTSYDGKAVMWLEHGSPEPPRDFQVAGQVASFLRDDN